MNGALPPSSIEQLITGSAASRSSLRPTSVEPVNDSLRTRGSCSMAPTVAPARELVMHIDDARRHPGLGIEVRPAHRRSAGSRLAGFSTQVQPAASAGAILRVAIAAGKFHGVIITATPIGWCSTRMRLPPAGAVEKSPFSRTASSANQRKNSAA